MFGFHKHYISNPIFIKLPHFEVQILRINIVKLLWMLIAT